MKTKLQKQESLKSIKDRLKKAKLAVITSFARQGEKGLTVADLRELRKQLRAVNSEYVVEKRTLFDKALKDQKSSITSTGYVGSLGVLYGFGDEFASAKVLQQFAKKFPVLKLYGGVYDGAVIESSMVMSMAAMPTREVLLGRLVGMLSYPIRGLAVTLNQIALKK